MSLLRALLTMLADRALGPAESTHRPTTTAPERPA
jgi:hypothetical protein